MINLDGSKKSGSGTILRYALTISSLLQEDLRMTNIRANRAKPGLRPQHLAAAMACKDMSRGDISGASVGSKEILFKPGGHIREGRYSWDIGTAGSTTMLGMTVLPLAFFARAESRFEISGGLFQDFAPSAHHMKSVLLPILARMGLKARIEIIRPGYVPAGDGVLKVTATPATRKIKPLRLFDQGKIIEIRGIALASHLRGQRVSERMAQSCKKALEAEGYKPDIVILYDESAKQPGAALAIYARTNTGCIIGSDMAGKVGRSSEHIGEYVARNLLEDLRTGATVDRFLADQIVIYSALAEGRSEYLVPSLTEHLSTNLWLVSEVLGARIQVNGHHILIDGIGFERG